MSTGWTPLRSRGKVGGEVLEDEDVSGNGAGGVAAGFDHLAEEVAVVHREDHCCGVLDRNGRFRTQAFAVCAHDGLDDLSPSALVLGQSLPVVRVSECVQGELHLEHRVEVERAVAAP